MVTGCFNLVQREEGKHSFSPCSALQEKAHDTIWRRLAGPKKHGKTRAHKNQSSPREKGNLFTSRLSDSKTSKTANKKRLVSSVRHAGEMWINKASGSDCKRGTIILSHGSRQPAQHSLCYSLNLRRLLSDARGIKMDQKTTRKKEEADKPAAGPQSQVSTHFLSPPP